MGEHLRLFYEINGAIWSRKNGLIMSLNASLQIVMRFCVQRDSPGCHWGWAFVPLIIEASMLSTGCGGLFWHDEALPGRLSLCFSCWWSQRLQMKVLRLGTRTLNNVCGIIRPVSDGPDNDERPGLRLSRSRAPCGLKDQSRTDKRVRFTQLTNKTQISVFPAPHADRYCLFFVWYFTNGRFLVPWSLPAGVTGTLPPFAGVCYVCVLAGTLKRENNTLCCVIYTLSVVLRLLFTGNFWLLLLY